ncbi:PLP-dependent aminotransferase family protein [Sphingomonas ginsenosidivorax]|uniref:PLP-dependent aminotransferase family protein n=1 Tax=Sphingomonas ginsenosidivorax TaxID=862135 RepID=A0A5C6UET0_9SPHN|nr:PLP-dependent aminotransferase family protein [Sphingomonas ginsenosidivorax]TXC70545.1 PLP-dependent aminotransferase family protein [Sphingomonas ginsenosidivorax]
MQYWTPDLTDLPGPKYSAIAAALSRDIARGVLRPGDRLPPQRVLAEQLSIDLTTVTKAYNEVRHAGLIKGGGRRGSFVSGAAEPTPVPEATPVDTGMNLPPEPEGSSLARRMRDGMAALLAQPHGLAALQYQPSGGATADRVAAAAALRQRGIDASEDRVLITSGGQNALHAIISATLTRGDTVCAGAFAYPGFLSLARRYGLTLAPVASDGEGILPEALERAAQAGAKAVYIVPENDNPTTATMGGDRRRAIAAVAERHGLIVIEDDAYGQLAGSPLPSIATLAPDRTWHIASVSKIISPGLRVAWVLAPSTRQAWRLAADLHETAVMAPPLNAALVSLWLRDGAFAALVGEVRAEAQARQALAAQILAEVPYASQPDGYHLWVPLQPEASVADIVNALRPAGLSVAPAEAFAVDPSHVPPALRVSIGGGLSRDRLKRTLGLLDALIAHSPGRRATNI